MIENTRLAVEVDADKIIGDVNLEDELPHGAKILRGEKWEKLAMEEFARGRTFRRPARPIYLVVEWTLSRGTVGRLLDWLDSETIPITRYAELFT